MPSSPAPRTTATGSPWWRCAAWLHAFAELPAPPAACGSAAPETLPSGAGRAVLDIVVAMLESHMEGVSA